VCKSLKNLQELYEINEIIDWYITIFSSLDFVNRAGIYNNNVLFVLPTCQKNVYKKNYAISGASYLHDVSSNLVIFV